MENTVKPRPLSRVRAMVECAMLIAAFMVLSRITFIRMPQGGSLTPVAGLPLLLIGYRRGLKWACISAVAATFLEMLLDGFYAPPAGTLWAFVLCLLLDYFLAQLSVVSAAGINRLIGQRSLVAVGISVLISQLLHFLCVFLSGFLLWGSYAPEGMGPVRYSFSYNASYCIPQSVLTMVVAAALFRAAPRLFARQP
ncbi:MAG: energy-coupled thiamine transporter ThiT [Clostridiaceae bacterium]|nr:energy-coupled thiamine transporter ThiT [Clostridiaceae bacterium]